MGMTAIWSLFNVLLLLAGIAFAGLVVYTLVLAIKALKKYLNS